MHLITDVLIREAANVILAHKYGREMSIALPNNKAEKWARYRMLVKQGSISHAQACEFYLDYLTRLWDEEYQISKGGFVTKR